MLNDYRGLPEIKGAKISYRKFSMTQTYQLFWNPSFKEKTKFIAVYVGDIIFVFVYVLGNQILQCIDISACWFIRNKMITVSQLVLSTCTAFIIV